MVWNDAIPHMLVVDTPHSLRPACYEPAGKMNVASDFGRNTPRQHVYANRTFPNNTFGLVHSIRSGQVCNPPQRTQLYPAGKSRRVVS